MYKHGHIEIKKLAANYVVTDKAFFVSLWTIIAAGSILRIVDCLVFNPTYYLATDPLRHWDNALHFFHPRWCSGMDPFLYQLYLWVIQKIIG